MTALGLTAEELRLVILTLLARGSLLAAVTILDAFLIDYDTSKSITPADWGQSAAHGTTGNWLRGWAVWDAVFFSDVAVRGYVYEQYYAFFPLLPGELLSLSSNWVCGRVLSICGCGGAYGARNQGCAQE